MTTPTHLRGEWWAGIVPDNANDFGWRGGSITCKIPNLKPNTYHWLTEIDDFMRSQGGEWQIVCTSKDITADQAQQIAPSRKNEVPNLNQFKKLFRSKGLDPDKNNYVILKKV